MYLKLLAFVLLFVVVVQPVYARGAPKCGVVERGDIKDVYDIAKDVRYYHDVRGDLDAACAALQKLEDWEDRLLREERHSKSYKNDRDRAIAPIQNALRKIKPPLKVMSVWLRVDPDNTRDEAVRIARIRSARDDVKSYQRALRNGQGVIAKFMSDYNKRKAQVSDGDR